ncbi:MAG: hypothetical protein WBQ76_13190 [Candidatus Korobacteraceae bacterium]
MQTDAQLLQRTETLIKQGQALFRYHPNDTYKNNPLPLQLAPYTMWRAQCVAFLVDFLGESHTYTQEFGSKVMAASVDIILPAWVTTGLGVLAAVRDDLSNGYFNNFKALVSAEVFTDLLTQAGYLMEQGYKDPAASLCGAVLENGLKRLALLRGVTVKGSDDLSAVNNKCAQANVYNRLVQKKVQVWNEVRNKADHGQFNEYLDADVREMLFGVQSLLSDCLR